MRAGSIYLLKQQLLMNNQQWESDQKTSLIIHEDQSSQQKHDKQAQSKEQNPYEFLQTARPILPPGIYKDYPIQSYAFKYSYVIGRNKLNKTTFPEVKNKNWMNIKQGCTQNNIVKQEQNDINEQHTESQRHEFTDLVEGLIPVFTRINLEKYKYNQLKTSDRAIMCSLFVDVKRQTIKSKKQPIYEYVKRLCKDSQSHYHKNDYIRFNSGFQSANLYKAYRNPAQNILTYELYMQNDTNTKGCTQWFYFSVVAQKRLKARFRIMNFYKPTSLYMQGMKILVCENNSEWKRVGTAIRYFRIQTNSGQTTYALQFVYEIEKPEQEYRFCYGYPYTYTEVQNFITKLTQSQQNRRIISKSVLCQSYLGNSIYLLNISSNISEKKQEKPVIYIIARQHPGETPASFITEGLVQTLISNRLEMNELRQKFMIKVVPIVNVDGTINGNYRSNFSGNDINRQWGGPSRKMHPQVFYLKQQISNNKKNVAFFLDIHAHSRKMNSFFYGSKGSNSDNQIYPFVCSKLNKFIIFSQSSFTDDPFKKTTARVILETQLNIKKSLTFEVSFYGYEQQNSKIKYHFSRQDLKGIGQSLALGLFYSEIGFQKYKQSCLNTQSTKNEAQDKSRSKNSACKLNGQKVSKKQQNERKVSRACKKIFEKWRKQLQKQRNQNQVFSQGSSLDPQHFQLVQEEVVQINPLEKHTNNHTRSTSLNLNSREEFPALNQEKSGDQILIFKNRNHLLDSNRQAKRKMLRSINCSKQTQHMVDLSIKDPNSSMNTFESNFRSNLIVHKLQSELQIQKNKGKQRYKRISEYKYNQRSQPVNSLANQLVVGTRFRSVEVQKKEGRLNYKKNIFQLKKALQYFIENKNDYQQSDYQDYKSRLWYATNGRSLIFSNQPKQAQTVKKQKLTKL